MRFAFLFALLAGSAVGAPPIELPTPAPAPPPPPVVGAAVKLTAGQVYDVRASVPCVVRAYPPGLVSIDAETVPAGETLRVRDTFTDGAKSRTYKGPLTVYYVRPVKTGECQLVITPIGLKVEADIVSVAIEANVGPRPPPPEPGPAPQPKPVPADLWGFVIVEETGDAVAGRAALLGDRDLASFLKAKGLRWRVVDKDVKTAAGETPPDVKPWIEDAKGKTLPQVYLVGKDGAKVYGGPCPKTAGELVKLIGGYAK